MRASLTVTADASEIVTESRRGAESLRDLRREAEATAAGMARAAEDQARATDRAARAPRQPRMPSAPSSAPAIDSRAYEQFEREQADAAARAWRALEESINPVIRAERELAAAQAVVNRALQQGQTTNTEAARTMAELERRYQAIVRAQSPAAASAAAMDRALEEETRSVRQLMLALDPVARSAAEFERAQLQLTRAVRAGIITQEEATRSLALLETQQQAVGRGGVTMGMGVQNASFQLTDFVVQVQAGQSASLALAQQLPQLLGGFGALGAVLGLTVALGVPLISMFFGAGDAAGTLDERLQRLDASLGRVSDNLKILRDESAAETFGNMTGSVRALTAELLALDRAASLTSLRESLEQLMKEKIEPTTMEMALAGLKAGYNTGPLITPGQVDALKNTVTEEKFGELTGGRGPSFSEFETRRDTINALAQAGQVKSVLTEVSALVRDFADGGPITSINKDLYNMLTGMGEIAVKTAEIEAEFNGTSGAARVWAGVVESSSGIWERIREEGAAIKADAEERLRIAENELALAEVIARHGEDSREAEAERDRIAREGYELEVERAGILGMQKDQLLEIWDAHTAVSDATATWADTMAGVRGEIEGILSAIASLGGGMVDRAAKQAELKALEAGATISDAAAAGRRTRRDAEYQARAAAMGGGMLGRTVAGVQRWWEEGGDRLDDSLADARSEARKSERKGRGGAGGSAGLGAIADVKGEIARLKPSYDADIEAAEAWRAKALAALQKTKDGYAAYAADVETIFQEKVANAYEADLKRRDDWAAGVARAQLKLTEDMTSWADVSEQIIGRWAQAGEDAFVSFATTGKATMGDFVNFVAEQFARLAYQQMILPGLNSILGSVSGAIGSAFGIPMGAPATAGAALSTNHTGSPGVMRSYAISGYGDTMRQDERLTMMRRGEEIMTSRALENAGALISAMSSLASRSAQPVQAAPAPAVQIVNNSSAKVSGEVQEGTDERGGRQYRLVLSDAVADALTTPGGSAGRAMRSQYGLKKRGIKR